MGCRAEVWPGDGPVVAGTAADTAPLCLCTMTDGRADSCLTSQDLQSSHSSRQSNTYQPEVNLLSPASQRGG